MVARSNDQLKASREDIAKIQDPQLKQQAEDRRAEQRQSLEPLVGNMNDTNKSFQALMKDLTDIKTYLAQDLTPTGVASVKDIMARANGNADSVNQKLDRMGQDLDQATARLRS
jgi:ABC-type transporter Mla subunit MlaD